MDIIVLYIHRNLSVFMVTFDFMKHVYTYIVKILKQLTKTGLSSPSPLWCM